MIKNFFFFQKLEESVKNRAIVLGHMFEIIDFSTLRELSRSTIESNNSGPVKSNDSPKSDSAQSDSAREIGI